jgi:hypothetical protein
MVAYTYATIIFLLLTVFNKTARERTHRFLNVSNGLILIVLFLNLIIVVKNALSCRSTRLETPGNYDLGGGDNCYHFLLWSIFLGFVFQLCFFFKRCRTNIVASIISLVMLFALNNLGNIYLLITSFFRDYLPSGWSFFYADMEQFWTLLISSAYFVFCWKISSMQLLKVHQ